MSPAHESVNDNGPGEIPGAIAVLLFSSGAISLTSDARPYGCIICPGQFHRLLLFFVHYTFI